MGMGKIKPSLILTNLCSHSGQCRIFFDLKGGNSYGTLVCKEGSGGIKKVNSSNS